MTAELAARVAAEPAAQGLPEHIEDDRVLDLVADLLVEVRLEHDDGPGVGSRAGAAVPPLPTKGGRPMLRREGDRPAPATGCPPGRAPYPQSCPSCGRSAA
jgi:hypothetical protein